MRKVPSDYVIQLGDHLFLEEGDVVQVDEDMLKQLAVGEVYFPGGTFLLLEEPEIAKMRLRGVELQSLGLGDLCLLYAAVSARCAERMEEANIELGEQLLDALSAKSLPS